MTVHSAVGQATSAKQPEDKVKQAEQPKTTEAAKEEKTKEGETPENEGGLLSRATSAVVKTSNAVTSTVVKTSSVVTSAVVKTSTAVSSLMRDEALRMRDFFDVQMPGTLSKHNLVLDFEPKAGDLLRREFVRYPLELRYGLGSKWETYVGAIPFSPNPFDEGEDHRWGLGLGKVGIRRDTTAFNFVLPRISFGLESQFPLGEPPVSLIDHYVHVHPWITLSRPLKSWEGATPFVAIFYDQSITCPARENVPDEVVRHNITEVAPGLLYMPGEYGAFVQYAFRYIEEPDGHRLGHAAKIGFIWDMPFKKSQRLHLPGKWQFELGYKISDEEGESPDHGVHARVKWRTNLFRKGGDAANPYTPREPALYR